jgi:hypothetical protein
MARVDPLTLMIQGPTQDWMEALGVMGWIVRETVQAVEGPRFHRGDGYGKDSYGYFTCKIEWEFETDALVSIKKAYCKVEQLKACGVM